MLKAHFESLAVLFLALELAAAPARAEMLLAEIGWEQPDPITLPASFLMRVVDPMSGNQASISTSLTSPDQTMAMTLEDQPSSMALFNQVLTSNNNTLRRAYISNDGQIINPPFGHSPFDAIWGVDPDPNDDYNPKAHVPQIGNGLFGYWITSVKQVVTPAGQTVYFYGTFIPEPSTALLMFFGCCLHVCLNRRGYRQ